MNRVTKILICTFLFSIGMLGVQAQQGNVWRTLSMVTFNSTYDEMMGMEVQTPTFGPIIEALEGKEVTVKGYIIPLSGKVKQSHFMFSSLPYNMCFFCGGAGPETAMEVFMDNGVKVDFTETKISVKGILRLNRGDSNNLIYSLENGVLEN